MKFKVRFVGVNGYAFVKSSGEVGLDELLHIREMAGRDLPLSIIDGDIKSAKIDPEIELTEEEARSIGFEDYNTAIINVAEAQLNWAICSNVYFVKNEETGEIKNAWSRYEVDLEYLKREWLESENPLSPTFDKDGYFVKKGGQE